MGNPPIQEHAKTTTLLIALFLGGCFPSASLLKFGGDESGATHIPVPGLDVNGCGILHVTPSLISFTSQSMVGHEQNHTVMLYIAPNRTREAAFFVMKHCRFIARTTATHGAAAFEDVPPGEYFSVLDDVPFATMQTDLSFGILNESGKLHVRWLDIVDSSVVVAMTIEAS